MLCIFEIMGLQVQVTGRFFFFLDDFNQFDFFFLFVGDDGTLG